MELEPRVKPLPYKIKAMSRDSRTQKAVHVLTLISGLKTNTKEWILLELQESCLLPHLRIHNKSLLEWEIRVGLRFKELLGFFPYHAATGGGGSHEFEERRALSRLPLWTRRCSCSFAEMEDYGVFL